MTDNTDDVQAVEKLGETRDAIVAEVRKAIVGMDDVIDEMMIAIFARGHCLLVGVPGLAKTLLVSSLAKTMSLTFVLVPKSVLRLEICNRQKRTCKKFTLR